jgi:periplasmic protein TonB
MAMTTQEEKKNQRIAAITTVGVHAFVLLLLFFLVAWRPPNPPHAPIGIEVNFGTDEQGSGNINPDKESGNEGPADEQPKEPEVKEEPVPEQSKVTPSPPVEEVPVSKLESPVVVKEEKKKPEPAKVEPKVEPKKDEPKVNDEAVYKAPTNPTDTKSTQPKQGAGGSEGDDVNKAGNKGQPDGNVDQGAVYKGPVGGGGNGFGLNMSGWGWASPPKYQKLTSTLSGKVKFEIEVDEEGQIIKITTLERTLNYDDEKMLRAAIEKSQLEKTTPGDAPPKSKGIVEFTLSLE